MKDRLQGLSLGRMVMAYAFALLIGAATAGGLLAWVHAPEARADDISAATEVVPVPDSATPIGPPPAANRFEVLRGEIRSGQTLHAALTRLGVDGGTVHRIAVDMRPLFDFR